MMAKQPKSNLRRLSNVLNVVGFGIEIYNNVSHTKSRKLSQVGLAINVVGGILDFYTALKSGRFLTKVFSFSNLIAVFATSYNRFKALRTK
ncbi:hypothetical protein CD149_08125 [Staphylococcus condimenti]|uniref:Uncharacterized protein n=2 Tax=Staphylococcus condimenti TaxID=70255 RepID=A0A4Q7CQ21_9STAP|nr:hypothetical protein [Staphylococcus epidermidis]PNZ59878.1 hypothetical protein CD149_08125 [Staphylococcus condimenti]RZI03571.1 hypothetical protein EIG98_06430 [Staphylococcus condimenti]RZI03674.1 hypothetical protein EIG99_02765 [Staphylococcus condimenti]